MTRAVKRALFACGFFHLLRVLFPNRRVAVLRYHAVVDPRDNFYTSPGISMAVREFEQHVRYFTRRYRVLSLDEVITALRSGQPLPRNAVVFTFDDGYADNFRAAQILRRHGANGTFYLTTDCIDRKQPLWLAEVNFLIHRAHRGKLRLEWNGTVRELPLAGARKRQETAREVVRIIKSNNRAVRETVRSQLRQQLQDTGWEQVADEVMLRWEQVRQMLEDGMVIGGHTLSHLNLPNADPDDARHEIMACRRVLEERLGRPVRHFSVPNSGPYAYYNKGVKQMVIASGYESAVTSAHGFVGPGSDPHELRRIRTVPELFEVIATMELGKFRARE